MKSSTVRAAVDPTIEKPPLQRRPEVLRQVISSEWLESGRTDLVSALRRHPVLLRDRSLLLGLAIDEYRARCAGAGDVDLEQHCHRFREFGSSIQRSILRQLEAQRFLDENPELLESLCAPDWPEVGDEFGNFDVVEGLGRGAIARVYLCRQRDVGNRQVVVKATPFPSAEASILGRLNHPNIVPIYSTGMLAERDLHYLCMPYYGRSTLSDLLDVAFQSGCPRRAEPILEAARRWLADEARPVRKWGTYVGGVLAIATQIAEALDHAHRQRILHGDLKPSNVLLTPAGQPLLLDFNLAQDHIHSPAVCGGTLPYMPPEHLRIVTGKSHGISDFGFRISDSHDQSEIRNPQSEIQSRTVSHGENSFDARSDIYSFGALLYELLAGVAPVPVTGQTGEQSAIAARLLERLERPLSPIRHHNPLVSRHLEAIVLRCLAFDPRDRPATMAEVRRSLQADMRSLNAVARLARVRPLFFSVAVGLPLAVAAAAGIQLAIQPPRYFTNYQQGRQLLAEGKTNQAAEFLTAAVGANPSFTPARFELARTQLALGELDAAMSDFHALARDENDLHAMAYLGYCFNLKRVPTAAIPWYERAIAKGTASAAIYNNLGACHLEAHSQLTDRERIAEADNNLSKALQLDPISPTVRLNIVRCAIAKSRIDAAFDPFQVWQDAQAILERADADRAIKSVVAIWYETVTKYDSRSSFKHRQLTSSQQAAVRVFSALSNKLDRLKGDAALRHYYLEPVMIAREQQP